MTKGNYLSTRQEAILAFLTPDNPTSTEEIFHFLFPDADYDTNSSMYRSMLTTLHRLEDRGLITRAYSGVMWKKTEASTDVA